MTTCCSIFGLVLLVLTNLAAIISFATPYWIEFRGSEGKNQGLWAICVSDSCTWVFEEAYNDHSKVRVNDAWWIAVQGLTCFGLALGLFSMLMATIALCCDCRGCNASHAIAGLLFMSFLSLGVAAVVFGISCNEHYGINLEMTAKKGKRLGWSFWLNCGASGFALLTGLIYIVEGRGKYA